MRTSLVAFAALAALAAVPGPAPAQVEVHASFRLGLPVAPPLVVVQPGVQVVQDHDDEVFVHGGAYWVRRGDRWYRSRGPQAAFVVVDTRLVPEPVRRLPPGHYRRYRPPPPRVEAHRLDKKEEKRLRKEEDEARKAHERAHDHGHDHGKDGGKGH
jgi:hypothetical protein